MLFVLFGVTSWIAIPAALKNTIHKIIRTETNYLVSFHNSSGCLVSFAALRLGVSAL